MAADLNEGSLLKIQKIKLFKTGTNDVIYKNTYQFLIIGYSR